MHRRRYQVGWKGVSPPGCLRGPRPGRCSHVRGPVVPLPVWVLDIPWQSAWVCYSCSTFALEGLCFGSSVLTGLRFLGFAAQLGPHFPWPVRNHFKAIPYLVGHVLVRDPWGWGHCLGFEECLTSCIGWVGECRVVVG